MNAHSLISPQEDNGKPRLTRKVAAAIDLLATSGKSQVDVAKAVGMNASALSRALAREGVGAYLETLKAQYCADADKLRGIAKAAAIREGLRLLTEGKSEQVRARMVEFFAGEPRQPTVAVQINNAAPGGYTYQRPDNVSDAKAEDAREIKGLPE